MWSLIVNYWWSRAKTRYQNWPKTTQAYFESVEITEGDTMMNPPKVQPLSYSPNQKMKLWSSSLYRMTVCLASDNIVRAEEYKLSNFPIPWVASNDLLSAYLKCQATSWLNLSTMVSWNIEFIVPKCHQMIYHLKIQHDLVLKKCFLSSTENYSKC